MDGLKPALLRIRSIFSIARVQKNSYEVADGNPSLELDPAKMLLNADLGGNAQASWGFGFGTGA
jgi:hypothetical protein